MGLAKGLLKSKDLLFKDISSRCGDVSSKTSPRDWFGSAAEEACAVMGSIEASGSGARDGEGQSLNTEDGVLPLALLVAEEEGIAFSLRR